MPVPADLSTMSPCHRSWALLIDGRVMRPARVLALFAGRGGNHGIALAHTSNGRWRAVSADRCCECAARAGGRADTGPAAYARRAIPLPSRHDAVHRLQVLRGGVQRAERQSGGDSTGAASARSKAASIRTRMRHYLSMGCNHCLEPTCMTGCPVDAYTKDPVTGIVLHSAERCIGCQYCTWNCSYGVPQYNPERGVVGKCDMCHGRLTDGREPACVAACPEQAHSHRDRQHRRVASRVFRSGQCAGLPSADDSISTTRVTLRRRTSARRRPRGCIAGRARASALAAGLHDCAHADGGRRASHRCLPRSRLAVRRLRVCPRQASVLIALLRARRLDAAPGPSDLRVSRAEDVAALVAEPRSAAVLALFAWRPSCTPACSGSTAGERRVRGHGRDIAGAGRRLTPARCIYLVPARPAWNTPATRCSSSISRALARTAVRGARSSRQARGMRWLMWPQAAHGPGCFSRR